MKRCIYCNKEKQISEFSDEHILPKAIGGNIVPVNPFKSNEICKRCNQAAGLFIDGPFIRSPLINNYRSENALRFASIKPDTILPLTFLGEVEEFKFEDKICDFYLGPANDLIYHFHDPYPKEKNTHKMVGVPPHLIGKEYDSGFAVIIIDSNNPIWHQVTLKSIADNFKNTEFYMGTEQVIDLPYIQTKMVPDDKREVFNQILDKLNKDIHHNKIEFNVYSGHRFTVKLGLGLASIFLNECYRSSDDAKRFRDYMWEHNDLERAKYKMTGVGIMYSKDHLAQVDHIMTFQGCHVLAFLVSDGMLCFYSNYYGQASTLIPITENQKHWEGKIFDSLVFVVMPERQKCIGPINKLDLIAHKFAEHKHPELLELENEIKNRDPLPPLRIENNTEA